MKASSYARLAVKDWPIIPSVSASTPLEKSSLLTTTTTSTWPSLLKMDSSSRLSSLKWSTLNASTWLFSTMVQWSWQARTIVSTSTVTCKFRRSRFEKLVAQHSFVCCFYLSLNFPLSRQYLHIFWVLRKGSERASDISPALYEILWLMHF